MPKKSTVKGRHNRDNAQTRAELNEAMSVRCPLCRKVAAETEEQAQNLASLKAHFRPGEAAQRTYQCYTNGPWHWTRADKKPPHLT